MSVGIEVTAVRELGALDELRKEWATLHWDAAPGSPFEHPAWAETWAKYYVPEGDLECVAVRDRALDCSLIGFVPLYGRHRGLPGIRGTCIQPLGTGRTQALTEVVQVLSLPGRTGEVVRAVLRHVEALEGWNWAQLSLGPTQGWLLPQWLGDPARATIRHSKTRPGVIFDELPSDIDALPDTDQLHVVGLAAATPVIVAQQAEPTAAPAIAPSRQPSLQRSQPPFQPSQASLQPPLQAFPEPALEPSPEPSLGSTLIASGILRKPHASEFDALAPIRRMSQAEKIAFFS